MNVLTTMKFEINSNKIFSYNGSNKEEIHPFWLRERVSEKEHLDEGTQQRLFDPSSMSHSIDILEANINGDILKVKFNDGVVSNFEIQKLSNELSLNVNEVINIEKTKWKSDFKDIKSFKFSDEFNDSKEMLNLLISFYKYGFVIIQNVPTNDNFLVNFGNMIGSVKRTNFGEFFNVKSKPDPNDLAYTALHLAPHTDNPYRNPFPPCIQILHCIENEVSGGFSTLVDGFTVTEDLKNLNKNYYDILSNTKVRFRFVDKDTILESWSELIHLDENRNFQNVRFSPRLDYVPKMSKDKLDTYYSARKYLSDLYNSDEYRIEFKLMPGDLMMMDNHRLLHGRTSYDPNEGKRFLQGCYLDFDSTEGKFLHLKRKFNL